MTPAVLLEAPGCSEMVAARVLRDVIRDLYMNNRLWLHRDTTATIDVSGTTTFTIPDESEIVEVSHLRLDTGAIPVRTVTADAYFAYEQSDYMALAKLGDEWTVRPAPAEVTMGEALLQLAPTQASTGLVDSQAHANLRLFQHLALAQLLAMPRQPWSAPNYVSYHVAKVIELTMSAKRRADGWSSRRTPTVGYGGI